MKPTLFLAMLAASLLSGGSPAAAATPLPPAPTQKAKPASPLGLPGAEELPRDLPPVLVELVDQFLDELMNDRSLQGTFSNLIKEIFKAELARVEAMPKDPEKAAYVARFIDEFAEELLEDPKVRQLFMMQLREVLRVQILIELLKDPAVRRMMPFEASR